MVTQHILLPIRMLRAATYTQTMSSFYSFIAWSSACGTCSAQQIYRLFGAIMTCTIRWQCSIVLIFLLLPHMDLKLFCPDGKMFGLAVLIHSWREAPPPPCPLLCPNTPNNNNNDNHQPRTLPCCLGPSPTVFLFSPAWKQNKAEAGGTQIGIGTLHIVPRASSSTFLGWLGSGPPVQEYCSNSAAPGTWPQLTTAASTDHCGAEAGWWLSLPHQSSFSHSLWLI